MEEKQIKDIESISTVFAGPKRLLILEFLSKEPLRYGGIVKEFERANIVSFSQNGHFKVTFSGI